MTNNALPSEAQYFIKNGYIPNQQLETMDEISHQVYWDKTKSHSAGFHQFYVYQYAVSVIRDKHVQSLMDVGCGVATKLVYLHAQVPDVRIIGIDQPSAIDYCKANYDFGTWYGDDFENPRQDLPNESTELIICADVIEHLLDPNKLLAYLKSKMSEDTLLILSTPERDLLRGRECMTSPNKHHIREWNSAELRAYLIDRGFAIIDYHLEYPVKIGLNRIYLSHMYKWLKHGFWKGLSLKSNQVFLLKKTS